MSIDRYYHTDIEVAPVIISRGSGGEVEYSYGTPYEIRGRVRMMSGQEGYHAHKRGFPADYRLYCPVSTQIKKEDMVHWTGKELEVVQINNVMEMNGHLEVDLKLR